MTGIERLLAQRRSIRAYLDRPVDRAEIAAVLTAARQAPSGANLQPGSFVALAGAPLTQLVDTLTAAQANGRPEVQEYSWFPQNMTPDLKAKQRDAGYALYNALGIERRDAAGRRAQFAHNYRFFDAPVGVVVSLRRDMGQGAFMDLGMALMALMLTAEARGLATTGIGALANYGDLVAETLDLPRDQMVICGIALGYPDPDAPVNAVRTARDALDDFAAFRGWDQ